MVNSKSSVKLPIIKNAVLLTGVGGAGKTDVVVRASISDIDPKRIWVSGPTETQVLGLQKVIKDTENRLKHLNLELDLTTNAKNYIIEASYDIAYGARPIKRFITQYLETLIADKIIKDEIKINSKLVIDVENNSLVIK